MEFELVPEQPPRVAEAVASLLAEAGPGGERRPDPWWQAGVDEALEP